MFLILEPELLTFVWCTFSLEERLIGQECADWKVPLYHRLTLNCPRRQCARKVRLDWQRIREVKAEWWVIQESFVLLELCWLSSFHVVKVRMLSSARPAGAH
jgi:hypothetical protein